MFFKTLKNPIDDRTSSSAPYHCQRRLYPCLEISMAPHDLEYHLFLWPPVVTLRLWLRGLDWTLGLFGSFAINILNIWSDYVSDPLYFLKYKNATFVLMLCILCTS